MGKSKKSKPSQSRGNKVEAHTSQLPHAPKRWTSVKFHNMSDDTVFTSVRTELLMQCHLQQDGLGDPEC